jgi:diguanylate cyclase (GGDEF)-like protein
MPPTQGKSAPRPGKIAELRLYSTAETINKAFNDFLHLRELDQSLLARYQQALHQGGEHFATVFYDYLLASPVTARVLENYRAQGGKIDDLVKRQLGHLWDLLSGNIGEDSARRMEHIGEIHYRYRIEPVWIMGAYLLYLNHLQNIIRTNPAIDPAHRGALEDNVTRLLFRDMGLQLEGYWDASLKALQQQTDKVGQLQEQITSLLTNIPQLLWSVDVVNNRPLYVSPSVRAICDMDIGLPIPCLGWTLAEDRHTVQLAWQQALAGNRVEVESRVQQPGGSTRWFRRIFYPFTDSRGEVVRIDGLMEDTTEAKAMIERLHTLATTDTLTSLPNRTLFHDRLTQAIATAARSRDSQVVLMLMDLDRFKEINDSLGHHAGDEVLVQVTHRLKSALRESDTLARLGGDEFAILLPDVQDGRKTAEKVVKNILQCFTTPFRYGDNDLYLGAGIGIVIFPEHGKEVATLLSRADVAMYGSKNRDIGHLYYDAALDPNAQQRLQLSGELRQAIQLGELELYYQPKVDLRKGCITSVEALIRWRHPQQGLLLPDQFIPLAERTGIIHPLTRWVIETAARQCAAWRAAGMPLRIAINISSRTLQDPAFAERIGATLNEHGAPPQCIEIEITENVLMTDIEHISPILESLSDMGVHIAIDDFGTGYSSLAYLKKLPLRTLKIDKSFVLDMVRDENDAVIVRSTIDLAHNLGYHVVAEGIENHETWEMLHSLGCDGGQGYHISHPLPAVELTPWLQKSSWCMPT